MRIDKEKIYQKFEDIRDSLQQLDKVKGITLEEFLQNRDYRDIAYANLIIITEAVIDICYHISAKRFSIAPASYGDCFEILGKNKIIPKDMELSLKKMAGFRNFIIHRYRKIDFKEVYKIITDSIVWINEFKQVIKIMLEDR